MEYALLTFLNCVSSFVMILPVESSKSDMSGLGEETTFLPCHRELILLSGQEALLR